MKTPTLPLTHLVPHAAKQAHGELLAALGTETNPAQWMEFMTAVTRLLPQVLATGRPTREAIQRSIIGQLGFGSWAAMIEAPVADGGLGWNVHSWKAWRRAWTVVEAHPWLREQSMTASEVNTLANGLRRQGVEMPSSADELAQVQAAAQAEVEAKKAEQVAEVHARLAQAEQVASQASAALSAAQGETLALREALRQAEGRQQAQQATINALQAQLAAPQPKLGRWQHLMAVIRG